MTLDFRINDAQRSLDKQQLLDWHRGWQVIDPAGGSNLVTVGTGNFEYDAATGDINAGGTTVTCSQETVDFANDIDADNDQLAVIYRDGSGNLQKTVGSTGTRDPAGQTVRQTHTPAAPSMHATDGVVLAEVLLPAGASSIGGDELRDRRLGDDLDVHFASLTTEQLTTAGFTGTPVWKEESGSPYTATGASSANSINPSSLDSFDAYLIFAKATDLAASSATVSLTVGGDTGTNYNEFQIDGTKNTGQTDWGPLIRPASNGVGSGWFMLNAVKDTIGFKFIGGDGSSAIVVSGQNTNVSYPMSQFTLSRGVDTDWEVRVWGRDI